MGSIELGDVVTLKSGSLPMTVNSINNDIVECFYANLQGDVVKVLLNIAALDFSNKKWTIMDIEADIDDDEEEEY